MEWGWERPDVDGQQGSGQTIAWIGRRRRCIRFRGAQCSLGMLMAVVNSGNVTRLQAVAGERGQGAVEKGRNGSIRVGLQGDLRPDAVALQSLAKAGACAGGNKHGGDGGARPLVSVAMPGSMAITSSGVRPIDRGSQAIPSMPGAVCSALAVMAAALSAVDLLAGLVVVARDGVTGACVTCIRQAANKECCD